MVVFFQCFESFDGDGAVEQIDTQFVHRHHSVAQLFAVLFNVVMGDGGHEGGDQKEEADEDTCDNQDNFNGFFQGAFHIFLRNFKLRSRLLMWCVSAPTEI